MGVILTIISVMIGNYLYDLLKTKKWKGEF